MACGLVKEAVLRQILQHLLTIHSKDEDDHVLLLAEEQLDTLQALLEEEAPRVDKPPLLRSRVHTNTTPVESDHAEEPSTSNGREATAMSSPSLTVDRQDRVTGAGENEDTRHVVQFMRRHGPGESLRIASSEDSSVLYATVGVIETQGDALTKPPSYALLRGRSTASQGTYFINASWKMRETSYRGGQKGSPQLKSYSGNGILPIMSRKRKRQQ